MTTFWTMTTQHCFFFFFFFFSEEKAKLSFFAFSFFSPPPPLPPSRPTTLPCDDTSTPFDERNEFAFLAFLAFVGRGGPRKTASVRREQSTAPGRERCWAATRMRRSARFALFVQSGWERQEFRARAYFCGKGERYFCFFCFLDFLGERQIKRKGVTASPKASQAILCEEKFKD